MSCFLEAGFGGGPFDGCPGYDDAGGPAVVAYRKMGVIGLQGIIWTTEYHTDPGSSVLDIERKQH